MKIVAALIFYIFILMLVQKTLMPFISNRLNNDINKLRKLGNVTVGMHKGKLGTKTYAAIAIKNDDIVELKVMNQTSVFSKFKNIKGEINRNYVEYLESIKNKNKKTSFDHAIEFALTNYNVNVTEDK